MEYQMGTSLALFRDVDDVFDMNKLVDHALSQPSVDLEAIMINLHIYGGAHSAHQFVRELYSKSKDKTLLFQLIEGAYLSQVVPVVSLSLLSSVSGLQGAKLCEYLCEVITKRGEQTSEISHIYLRVKDDDVAYILSAGLIEFIPKKCLAEFCGLVTSGDVRATLLGESVRRLAASKKTKGVELGVTLWKDALRKAIDENPAGNATRMAMSLALGRNTKKFADREFVYEMLSSMFYRSTLGSTGFENFTALYEAYMRQTSVSEEDKHWLWANISNMLDHAASRITGLQKEVRRKNPLALR